MPRRFLSDVTVVIILLLSILFGSAQPVLSQAKNSQNTQHRVTLQQMQPKLRTMSFKTFAMKLGEIYKTLKQNKQPLQNRVEAILGSDWRITGIPVKAVTPRETATGQKYVRVVALDGREGPFFITFIAATPLLHKTASALRPGSTFTAQGLVVSAGIDDNPKSRFPTVMVVLPFHFLSK